MRRLHYKNGTFKDVDDSQSWEYENDPDWERTEDISMERIRDDLRMVSVKRAKNLHGSLSKQSECQKNLYQDETGMQGKAQRDVGRG